MTVDTARLRELATILRDDLNLGGRWRWNGNLSRGSNPNIHLCTVANGQVFVLGFTRAGMQGAQPLFPHKKPGRRWSSLVDAKELPVFEVAPDATSKDDPRVYRGDIKGFRTPVADYLAAVDADTVLALLDRIAELEARLDTETVPA